MNKLYRILTIIVLVFSTSTIVQATTYYSTPSATIAMNVLANWWTNPAGSGSHPANFTASGDIFNVQATTTATGTITMGSGTSVNINGSWTDALGYVGTVLINSGGILSQGNGYLSVLGNWTNAGSYIHNSRGYLRFQGTTNQTMNPGSSHYYNIHINNLGTSPNNIVSITSAISIDYLCVLYKGNFQPFTGSVFTYIIVYANGILNAPSSLSIHRYWLSYGTFYHNNGTVNFYNTSTISIYSTLQNSFYNLNIFSKRTLNSDIIIDGNLTINTASYFDVSTSNYNITIKGDFTNNGNFIYNNGNVIFNGTTNQAINGTGTNIFYNLDISNSGSSIVSLNRNIIVSNNLTIASGSILSIEASKVLTVTNTITNSGGTGGLILRSNSETTTALLLNNVSYPNATVERYVSAGPIGSIAAIKHYVSPAVSNATGAVLYDAALGGYNIYTLVNNAWARVYTNTSLTAGTGYLVNYNNGVLHNITSKTISFAGTLNNGTINPGISTTNGTSNMLGNPYPCTINSTTFVTDNATQLQGTLYFWDQTATNSNDYATWNLTGGTANSHAGNHGAPTGYIASGQSFMVASNNNGSSTAVFNNAMKANSSPRFFIAESNTIQRCYISISNPKNDQNSILIGFTEAATTGYDQFYDGIKLKGNPELALFSMLDNNSGEYAIQGLPQVNDCQIVKIGLDAGLDGLYTFNLGDLEDFDFDINIYLKDLRLNKTIDLRKENTYSFYTNQGIIKDRFVVVFKRGNEETIIDQKKYDPIFVFSSAKELYITNLNNETFTGEVYVYDMMGKVIYNSKVDVSSTIQIAVNKPTGYYIVNIRNDEYSLVKKVFVD
jgi:hypothetical protein